ncbi:unnamed protein product [Commensalibacter papalotli (ex Botero et al. 2024)]|uniref:Transposase n=1 Tax=Commensalibacter papalotli (ex Botero et al. 2024) TaxID=2972766 RepID=A0ABM9HPF3_9PROT|nr:unnamed protein product [Commensalibacter papalotli (ex Botero et al. 2024)]
MKTIVSFTKYKTVRNILIVIIRRWNKRVIIECQNTLRTIT